MQSVQAIEEIVVRSVEGHPILVRDVGKVVDGEEEAETAASIAGKPAVVLSIRKQSGSNSVAVVDALMERVKEVDADLPGGLHAARRSATTPRPPAPASTR